MNATMGIILSAGVFGVFSSLHCLGMCTPLASQFNHKVSQHLFYQFGRFTSYQILGGVLYFFSDQLLKFISLEIQHYALYVLISIYFLLALSILLKKQSNYLFGKQFQSIFRRLFKKVAPIKNSSINSLGIGLLSGLLPCGLLHTFLLGVIPLENYFLAFLYISAFWLGTSPALAFGNYSFHKFKEKLQRHSPQLISSTYFLMAIYLVYVKHNVLSQDLLCH